MSDYYVHGSSYVDDGVVVGRGTKIWHFSHVMPGAQIGEDCNRGQNVVVMPNVKIDNNVKVQNNVSLYGGEVLPSVVGDAVCGRCGAAYRIDPDTITPLDRTSEAS